MLKNKLSRIEILLESLGIDSESFLGFIEWALTEQLVRVLSQSLPNESFYISQDALKKFRNLLKSKTGRNWSVEDLNALFAAVKLTNEKHFREPITYGEYLRLLWNTPHKCVYCGLEPPQVKLHIDHIRPASLGGNSKFPNLQFLCSTCNLKKSNKLEEELPWLNLQ